MPRFRVHDECKHREDLPNRHRGVHSLYHIQRVYVQRGPGRRPVSVGLVCLNCGQFWPRKDLHEALEHE